MSAYLFPTGSHPVVLQLAAVLLFVAAGIYPAQAQQRPLVRVEGTLAERQRINPAVAALGGEGVTTGVLHDRVLPLVGLDRFDGQATAPRVDFKQWRQAYFELYHSHLGAPLLPTVQALQATAAPYLDTGTIPLAIMDFRYEAIRTDAFERDLLRREDGRLKIVPQRSESPFRVRRAFAAAPLKAHLYAGRPTSVVLDPAFYLTNDRLPSYLSIDFSDGAGPQQIRFGDTVTLRYASPGVYTLTLTAHFAGGVTRHATTALTVRAAPAVDTPPDLVWEDLAADLPYLGETATYDAYIWLGAGNTAITQPLLFIEGFDLDNSLGWEEIMALLSQENLADDMLAAGYDVVIMNFNDATDYIQRNAFALVHLIEEIQAERVGEAPLVITGASMGGLVARYALSWMETNGLDHQTRLYGSFDSPHQSANIPLGLQHFTTFFADFTVDAELLLGALNSVAAQQLLVYHHLNLPDPSQNTLRDTFFAELAAQGDWPTEPRLVAIANGNGTGAGQAGVDDLPMNPGTQIIEWDFNTLLADIVGNVWAVPDDLPQTQIFEGVVDVFLVADDQLNVFASGTLPYDNAPGGTSDSQGQAAAIEPIFELIGLEIILGDILTDFPDHSFIPTISALDVRGTDGEPVDLFTDLLADPDLLAKTPFDAVYVPQENQPHVDVTTENAAFILEQIALDNAGAAVSGTLTALAPPIVIPPAGGAFSYTIALTNNTAALQPVTVSIMIEAPGGLTVGPVLFGTPTLAGNAALEGTLSQNIPAFAPTGDYDYILYVADTALGDTLSSDTLSFSKDGPPVAAKVKGARWPAPGGPAALLAALTTAPPPAQLAEASPTPDPGGIRLAANYPNPFRTQTAITFTLPSSQDVRLVVYDLLGRAVAQLAAGPYDGGTHTVRWSGRADDGRDVAPGVYVYRLTAGPTHAARTLLRLP